MKKSVILAATVISMLVLSGCGQKELNINDKEGMADNTMPSTHDAEENPVTLDEMDENNPDVLVEPDEKNTDTINEMDGDNMNTFDIGCYIIDELCEEKGENVLFSPLSLDMAMAMLKEGAAGSTAEELDKYLSDEDEKRLSEYVNSVLLQPNNHSGADAFNNGGADALYNDGADVLYNGGVDVFGNGAGNVSESNNIDIANAVFYDETIKLKDDYINTITAKYDAKSTGLSFADADGSAEIINDWCSEKTRGMIPSIVDENTVRNSKDSAILTNALYFKSDWFTPLDETDSESDFENIDGSTSKIKYLYGEGSAYYENEFATAFEYPYKDNCVFIGILPKVKGRFNIKEIDLKGLLDTRDTDYDRIDIRMPSLEYETDNSIIKRVMSRMGFEKIFSPTDADFSKMSDASFFVGDIIQKCKIILDKNGTEASAVTAIELVGCAPGMEEKREVEVVLDRPYAFAIKDCNSDSILFLGKVISQ